MPSSFSGFRETLDRVKVKIVNPSVLARVQVFSHQQAYGSTGVSVEHQHTAHCTVLYIREQEQAGEDF